MAKEIRKVEEEHAYDPIVVVIGAGHLPNLKGLLSPWEVETMKLSDII